MPGEPIVLVAAAARHRREAFAAADYAMDHLKSESWFWKRELVGGEVALDRAARGGLCRQGAVGWLGGFDRLSGGTRTVLRTDTG